SGKLAGLSQECLYPSPRLLVDDRLVLPLVGLALIHDAAYVELVAEDVDDALHGVVVSAVLLAATRSIDRAGEALVLEETHHLPYRTEFKVLVEDLAHDLRLLAVDERDTFVFRVQVIAERPSTVSEPLCGAIGHRGRCAFARGFAFEFCEHKDELQGCSPHGCSGVEVVAQRDELGVVLL